MKRYTKVTTLLVLLVLLAGACTFTIEPRNLAVAESANECTLATLKGTYIFEGRGVIVDDSGTEDAVLPYAEAGSWTLDGEGNAEGVASITINGEVFAAREAFSATYEHVSGCIFTAADGFGLEFDLYTTPAGETVTYFSPGFSGTMFQQ